MKLMFTQMLTVFSLILTSQVYAGGIGGGGGPPALEELQDMLPAGRNTATVFDWDKKQLGLGTDASLDTEILITRSPVPSTAIHMSADDFNRVAARTQVIQAINLNGDTQSYEVERTPELDTLRLVAPATNSGL